MVHARGYVVFGKAFKMSGDHDPVSQTSGKILTPEAQRALAEAAARRKAEEARAVEIGGPEGPEPTRYGDWERRGIASDF